MMMHLGQSITKGGVFNPLGQRKRMSRKRQKGRRWGTEELQPPPPKKKSISVDKSLCSSYGATVLPQLTSRRTDRKV